MARSARRVATFGGPVASDGGRCVRRGSRVLDVQPRRVCDGSELPSEGRWGASLARSRACEGSRGASLPRSRACEARLAPSRASEGSGRGSTRRGRSRGAVNPGDGVLEPHGARPIRTPRGRPGSSPSPRPLGRSGTPRASCPNRETRRPPWRPSRPRQRRFRPVSRGRCSSRPRPQSTLQRARGPSLGRRMPACTPRRPCSRPHRRKSQGRPRRTSPGTGTPMSRGTAKRPCTSASAERGRCSTSCKGRCCPHRKWPAPGRAASWRRTQEGPAQVRRCRARSCSSRTGADSRPGPTRSSRIADLPST